MFLKFVNQEKMLNLDTLFLFIFIFSILSSVRILFKFIISLLRTPPNPLVMVNGEIFYHGIMFTYLLTYLITNT